MKRNNEVTPSDFRKAGRQAAMIYDTCAILSLAVLLRLAISIGSYSGFNVPPRYGDYEAQRHWMEITINLPPSEWYKNSTVNDASYWGLDYPPLSGYQSWVHGKVIQFFEADAVELLSSHGYETPSSKVLMRWSVIFSDILIFFPGAVLVSKALGTPPKENMALLLMLPSLMLIDHGHFQYNCISLGFFLLSVACILSDRDLLGSALFVAALSHKHMSMYFAMALFAHLFGKCLQRPTTAGKVAKFCALGATVICSVAVMWLPFLGSVESFLAVIRRLTPVSRGLFEDYVSNFWCVTSVVIKWKQLLDPQTLVWICGVMTLMACLPSMLHQILKPSKIGFLYGLVNSSLAFYLFSFQVHEKSILMADVAVSLLTAHESLLAQCFHLMAAFSMFPLLEKDGVALQYSAILLFFLSFYVPLKEKDNSRMSSFVGCLVAACGVLHGARAFVKTPEYLPFLHDLFFACFSFAFFFASFIYLNYRQWQPARPEVTVTAESSSRQSSRFS